MKMSNTWKRVTAAALSVCLVATGSVATLALTAEPAWANNGNGNGGNKANRGNNGNNNRGERAGNARGNNGNGAQRVSNGRGAIASELKSLNAAHASPTALANAAPGSMPGKLREYRDTYSQLIAAVDEQNVAYAEFQRLSGLTDDEIAEAYPDGGYDQALSEATATYSALRDIAATAQGETQETLTALTGGRTLSDAAMAELHGLLGL